MKTNKVIVLIIILILGGIIFWKREEIKKRFGFGKDSDSEGTNSDSGTNLLPSPSPSPLPVSTGIKYIECNNYPLRLGCKGNNVLNLQKALNRAYKSGLTEDGYFGQKTEAALITNGYGNTLEMDDMLKITRAMV
ncbi:MAG TPA: peptidoglycan-binding domain-containing protein [Bacteroidales bacterium]|nr:peptidoglycan-binding domain-containing protein [Bacteroidales bacterium]